MLWSTGAGADVMKRIAAPMVGGLVTSFLLELHGLPGDLRDLEGQGPCLRVISWTGACAIRNFSSTRSVPTRSRATKRRLDHGYPKCARRVGGGGDVSGRTLGAAHAEEGGAGAKIKCEGVNSCKGQSECKSAGNDCKGKNSCSGKGFMMMSKAECDAAKAKAAEKSKKM